MKKKNKKPAPLEILNPVDRKTNEEIEEDDVGNLTIEGAPTPAPDNENTTGIED